MINLIKISWPYMMAFVIGFYISGLYFINKINQLEVNALNIKTDEQKAVIHFIQKNITQNEKLATELEQKQNNLITTSQHLEKDITGAIKKDGTNYNGIGANSLQLYKRALGYSAEDKTNGTHDK